MKKRLDLLLVDRGLSPTREQARSLIMAGAVAVEGVVVDKPGTMVDETAGIEVAAAPRYVSRGGLKLERALDAFGLDVAGRVAVDVGASTGGFTDCLLQRGAARVYAVDVGYGQLDWRLRSDPRVVVLERTNARHLAGLPEPVDLATVDVSFISLRLVLPSVARLLRPGGRIVALVKPQFEAGRRQVGKGGVVRDPEIHRSVLLGLAEWAGREGFGIQGLIPSPIRGPAGNVEFLALLAPGEPSTSDLEERIRAVVREAQGIGGPGIGLRVSNSGSGMGKMNPHPPSVALIFQPMLAEARKLAERCAGVVQSSGYTPRLLSAWELGPPIDNSGLHMAVTFGGDGTIIRAARWLAGTGVPILGVTMGRLGFMTELPPETACEALPSVLEGDYWLDERIMIAARVLPAPERGEEAGGPAAPGASGGVSLLALNDVVIGRGASLRVARIDVSVDGMPLASYVADGLVVATPTGSTAYALAAGGPVLAPAVQGLVVVPVAAHLAVLRSLVVPASARIEVRATSEQAPLLVLDGQVQMPLENDQPVTMELARERTMFARVGNPSGFYATLVQSLKKR